MKSIMLVMIVLLTSSLVYGQREPVRPGSRGDTGGRSLPKGPEATETKRPAPKKPPVEIAELIFKRMDSNHDGSISLKEFKVAFPRLRQSSSRSSGTTPREATRGYSRGSGQPSSPSGRTRGFDGKAPGFRPPEKGAHPKGASPSRGRSSRGGSRGRSRGSK